jgi:methylmalonyl-CoA mutase
MASASGVDSGVAPPEITVRTLNRMLTRRDPWVNMLRTTSASFGAVLGGADAVVTAPFDTELGDPVELSRRMARNTQLLVGEESGAGRVIDPSGGSWYIETLTEELARTGWETFRVLEGAGGMPSVLVDGTLQTHIAQVRDARLADVARRKQPITGVSEFPDIHESPLVGRSIAEVPKDSYEALTTVEALQPVRWAHGFETLRDNADATAERPSVFLANLGPVAVHTARASFAKNFFEAGGIEAMTSEIGSKSGFADTDTLAADFSASPARVAVICSSDAYTTDAVPAVAALKAAGADLVYLAGRPGDLADDLEAAGVDGYVGVGVDVLKILQEVHERIGVPT